MVRKVALALGFLGLTYFVFAVRLGARTLAEHVHAIGQTREAKDLANGASQAVVPMLDQIRTRLMGERVETGRTPGSKAVTTSIAAEGTKAKTRSDSKKIASPKAADPRSAAASAAKPTAGANAQTTKAPGKASVELVAKLRPMPDEFQPAVKTPDKSTSASAAATKRVASPPPSKNPSSKDAAAKEPVAKVVSAAKDATAKKDKATSSPAVTVAKPSQTTSSSMVVRPKEPNRGQVKPAVDKQK